MLTSVGLASVVYWAGFGAYLELKGGVAGQEYYLYLWFALMVALGAHGVFYCRTRRGALGLAMNEDLWWVSGQMMAVALVSFGFLVAAKDRSISRLFLFSYLAVLPVALQAGRKMSVKWMAPLLFDRRHQCGALIVGAPAESRQVLEWIQSKAAYGLKALGWIADEPESGQVSVPRLGTSRDLERVMAELRPGVVFATSWDAGRGGLDSLREICDRHGARLALSLHLPQGIPCGITCFQEDGVNLIALRHEPLESPLNRFVKRSLDIAIALPVVLFILPPLALAVWLLQCWQSPGPLLFRQSRGGLRHRPFMMLKFRTMHVDNPDEGQQATQGDARIYPGGRWLRRLSLDEFPQFINVLRGDMSVVGPRPHYEAHDEAFAGINGSYRVRALIKPGITGLAQVKGYRGPTATHEDVHDRTREDLYYLEHWSLFLDLVIILRTALQFIFWSKRAL